MTSRRSDQATDPTLQLLTDLGHELRTPLAVIRIQTQMLQRALDRQPPADPTLRQRCAAGLERIDHAVSTLNAALERTIESEARARLRREPPPNDAVLGPPGPTLAN